MKSLERIRESVCSDLDEISTKPRMDRNDLELVSKMVDIIKDIDTIDAMEEGGYSYDGEWNPGMNGSQRGRSYRNGSYGNGSYGNGSYGNGESYRRSRTGYMMPDMEYDESRRIR